MATTNTRFNKSGWGNIVGGILQLAGQSDFLVNSEEAAADLDETKRDFGALMSAMYEHPQGIWTAVELIGLCDNHKLFADALGTGSIHSRSTRFGKLAGRFVNDTFHINESELKFVRKVDRNGSHYQVLATESAVR